MSVDMVSTKSFPTFIYINEIHVLSKLRVNTPQYGHDMVVVYF